MTEPSVAGSATLAFTPTPELPTRRFLEVAQAAEAAGLDEVWLWEDVYRQSATTQAATMLAATEHLRIGLGVLPVPLRNVVLTAMELSTLVETFPGRLVPGIGHGVQSWMEEIGARAASPLTQLREQADAVRALLRGETFTSVGRYVELDNARLVWPPASPPPLYVAGHGPRTLRLVGEVADGVILELGVQPDDVRRKLRAVAEGRAAAGRSGPFGVCAYVGVSAALRSAGAEATAAHLRQWADAGVTTIAVVPVAADGSPDMTDPAAVASWLGTEVRSLLDAAEPVAAAPQR